MALPSQFVGGARTRSHMYRRARRRGIRRIVGLFGAVAVVVWVVVLLRPEGGGGNGGVTPPGAPADLGGADRVAARSAGTNDGAAAREADDRPVPAAPSVARPEPRLDRPETTRPADPVTPADVAASRPSRPTLAPAPAPVGPPTAAGVLAQLDAAMEDIDRRPLAAREELSRLLVDNELGSTDAALVREALSALNEQLVFGMRFVDGDPYVEEYRIRSGDALSQLPRRRGWNVGWRLIADISGISNPARLQIGQPVKGLRGPFHAVVTKEAHRLDVWMGDPTAGPVYVTSFDVGLGRDGRTPVGRWAVHSKDVNPSWIDPDTGERFSRDDPENPIGERWIGIRGLDPANAGMQGFGIHGTIDDDSIGGDESLGCVRLQHDDIVRLYDLIDDDSLVVIRSRERDPLFPRP